MHRTAIAAAIASFIVIPAHALAQDLGPAQIVQRHIDSGGNVDAIVADYAENAVVMQQGRVLRGRDAIRAFYTQMMAGQRPAPPADAPGASSSATPARPAGGMQVTRVWEEGDVGFVTWEMGPIHATEEFLVREGKIQVQAVFMSGAPAAPAAH